MNDLDLAAALRRDADLVGDPPADLLDRLRERRRREHRRTTAVGCVLAFVVVVAGGIPALGAFVARSSDGATSAVDSTTAPASTTSTGVPTPVSPTASAPASTPTDPQATVTAAAVSGPPCDLQLLATALPADSAERRFRIVDVEGPWCSGEWAAASYSETWVDEEGQEWPDGQAGLFRFDGTAWRLLDRSTSCDPAVQPPVVWTHACDVD